MNHSRNNIALFLSSFIILFLEMALIRWVATEIRVFSYLTNFVLLACFIGIGLGCYLSDKKIRLYVAPLMMSLLIVCIIMPLNIQFGQFQMHIFRDIPTFLAAFDDTVIHYQKTVPQNLRLMQLFGVASTLFMFFTILMIFVPLGQILGRIFNEHPKTIKAYSINIVASLLGVWAFSAMCFIYTPPWLWMLITLGLMMVLMAVLRLYTKKTILAFCLSLFVMGLMITQSVETRSKQQLEVWTPYQKLTLSSMGVRKTETDPLKERSFVGYMMNVNNVGFMNLLNLSGAFRNFYPSLFKNHPIYRGEKESPFNRFDFPFVLKQDAKTVLILGAGAGNDAAGALRAGYQRIDTIEIDPGIVDLGRRYHPEDPYNDPVVHLYVDDARSFIKKTDQKYDVVFFGLLDAHAQSSNLNNVRMDSYVYTRESFQDAKRLLKEDGLFVVGFWIQRLWIGQRIAQLVEEAFGWKPIIVSVGNPPVTGHGPIMILAGHDRDYVYSLIRGHRELSPYIIKNLIHYDLEEIPSTTDDWPYLYLIKPLIPKMHLCLIGILAVLFFLSKGFLIEKGQRLNFHFFFLGAAFLLLEFQNINKTSLLFGSTWLVNSINISAILFLILLANWFVSAIPIKNLKVIYFLLFISLLVIYLVPLSAYNAFAYWQKSILASIVLNLPIFFAGIIFATSFKSTPHKNLAFGSNLIGAVIGGLLEYLSFLFGIRMLVLVTMALYLCSFIFLRKSVRNA